MKAELPFNGGPPILMWHGGRIDGAVEIQPPRKGRCEAGPGLYLTTHYNRALKYAKGGGATFLVTLRPILRFADQVAIPMRDGINFVNRHFGPDKTAIIADLQRNASDGDPAGAFKANILINLIVSHDAATGQKGLALVAFLRDHGVDAAIETISTTEQWIIVFNPDIVIATKKLRASKVPHDLRELPTFELWRSPRRPASRLRNDQTPAPDQILAGAHQS